MREAEDLYGFDEAQGASWGAVTAIKPEDKSDRRGGVGATIFVGVIAVVLVLALSQLPTNSPAPKAISALPDTNPHPGQGGFGQMIGNLIQSKTSGTLREDFHSGLSGWEGLEIDRFGLEPRKRRSSAQRFTALEAFHFPVQLRTRIPGPDRSQEHGLGLSRRRSAQLLRHQTGDDPARAAPQRRSGSLRGAGWAGARARGTAAAA